VLPTNLGHFVPGDESAVLRLYYFRAPTVECTIEGKGHELEVHSSGIDFLSSG